jgi:hypothetical protein
MMPEMEPVIIAKCVGCSAKVELRAGDVAPGDHPCCPKCGMPMVAVVAVAMASVKRKQG